jgi:hypothetical protein
MEMHFITKPTNFHVFSCFSFLYINRLWCYEVTDIFEFDGIFNIATLTSKMLAKS